MAKTSLFVEYNGNKVEDKAIIAAVKKEWTEAVLGMNIPDRF